MGAADRRRRGERRPRLADRAEHVDESQGPRGEARGHGCYLSIWRKQPDGLWRVYIDVGTRAPEGPRSAAGFHADDDGDADSGKEGKEAATRALAEADRELNAQLPAVGAAAAFAPRLTDVSRFHRGGRVPIVGRDRIVAWLEQNPHSVFDEGYRGMKPLPPETSASTWTFEIPQPKPATGAYVAPVEPRRVGDVVADGGCRAVLTRAVTRRLRFSLRAAGPPGSDGVFLQTCPRPLDDGKLNRPPWTLRAFSRHI